MIIRIEASGTSFMGAGRYFLHDKLSDQQKERIKQGDWIGRLEQTDERVWFTQTRNCLNIDPERALEEMWMTAEDQAALKMQAGVARGGRRCDEPVKTISLSWHKDDRPDVQHMTDAADSFLKHMGWERHQAVFVGHNDTDHRHIHIVLNRIDPETGRTMDDFREQKRAQVWALAYEKQHENVRCEERELRAAMREKRAPELNPDHGRTPDIQPTAPTRTPANDHLPYNVVALTRPMQRDFAASEQARAEQDALSRAALKAEQRAEREAFFKEGAALFKATRHAVYDEVRKEYAAEWREFYKDSKAAEKEADAWSRNAVSRALYFGRDGNWEEARNAFGDKDSVRDSSERQLAERKADLKDRQTRDLRERQKDALDALRDIRDVQYQELLQRQRDARAELQIGQSLEQAGMPPRAPDAISPIIANENAPASRAPAQSYVDLGELRPEGHPTPVAGSDHALVPSREVALPVSDAVSMPLPDAPEATRQIADLAAGSIGAVADYLADQLGEMFAPTPPEVREAQAAAEAKRDAQKEPEPSKDEKARAYARIIDASVKLFEAERADGAASAYWKERDRGKDWERDR